VLEFFNFPVVYDGVAKRPVFGLEIPMLYIGTLAQIYYLKIRVFIQSLETVRCDYSLTYSQFWKPALIFKLIFYFALSFPNVFIGNPVLFQRFSLHFSLDFEFSHSLCQSGETGVKIRKLPRRLRRGWLKHPYLGWKSRCSISGL